MKPERPRIGGTDRSWGKLPPILDRAGDSDKNPGQRLACLGDSRVTMRVMQFALFAMKVLEVMFFLGLAGSTVVVLISFVEDGKELFGKDE